MVQRATTNDNEWQRMIQRVTTSGTITDKWRMTTSYNKWQRVRVKINDNEWQRVVFLANFPFSQIREELTLNTLKRHFKH